jgi:ABC-2 type transport system permease protein
MSNFTNILKKEVKELITPQMIGSMIFMVVFFVFMGYMIGGITKEAAGGEVNLAILDQDKSQPSKNIIDTLAKQANVTINALDENEVEHAIGVAKEKGALMLLVIPEGFENKINQMEVAEVELYSIVKGFGMRELASTTKIQFVINLINEGMAIHNVQEAMPDQNPIGVLHPILPKNFIVIKEKVAQGNPAQLIGLMMSQSVMIPVILMIVIMYSGSMVITSMGMEKENKTIETLLTLPVKRTHIIAGKIVGSSLVALLMAGVFMIGFGYYMQAFTQPSQAQLPASVGLTDLGLTMGPMEYGILGISLFLAILVALSLSMILGVYSQDVKSAQMMIMPIMLMVFIPFFLLMFMDVDTLPLALKILLYAIPFSHPIIASRALLFHNYLPVVGGIAYMAGFALVTWWFTVRIFNTDKVLTAKLGMKKFKKAKVGR